MLRPSTKKESTEAPLNPAILFLPVSGPDGSGEYYRCLMLAEALRKALPAVQIDFGISQDAKYITTCPFDVITLPASPTKSAPQVRECLLAKHYQVVVFDCAGRAELFRFAQKSGAKTVFISSRPRARQKGLRWRWLPYLDEHWSVQPVYLVSANSTWEKLKTRLMQGPTIRNIGSIFPEVDRTSPRSNRLLVTLGGGGYLPEPEKFQQTLYQELRSFAKSNSCSVDWVLGANSGHVNDECDESVIIHASLPPSEFVTLLAISKVVLTNGGSTLSQAVELGCKVVSTPLAPDQHARVKLTAELGYSMSCEASPHAMINAVQSCWTDRITLKKLPDTGTTGIASAIEQLSRLLGSDTRDLSQVSDSLAATKRPTT